MFSDVAHIFSSPNLTKKTSYIYKITLMYYSLVMKFKVTMYIPPNKNCYFSLVNISQVLILNILLISTSMTTNASEKFFTVMLPVRDGMTISKLRQQKNDVWRSFQLIPYIKIMIYPFRLTGNSFNPVKYKILNAFLFVFFQSSINHRIHH